MNPVQTLRRATALAVLVLAAGGLTMAHAADSDDHVPLPAKKVNINTAGEKELRTLRGVGPALARRIMQYREENGRFRRIEEIINVRGIGEKTFLLLKVEITVGKPTSENH